MPAAGAVPTYRGNAERTGENPGPAPTGEPVALWQARLGTVISGSPSVVGGVVYIGSLGPGTIEGGFLHAVDAASGIEVWRLGTAPGDGIFTTPTVSDRVVIAGTYDGIVVAADPVTGTERWRFQAEAPFYASPALVDGIAYLADTGGHLYALDAESGAERWRVVVGSGFDHAFGDVYSQRTLLGMHDSRAADQGQNQYQNPCHHRQNIPSGLNVISISRHWPYFSAGSGNPSDPQRRIARRAVSNTLRAADSPPPVDDIIRIDSVRGVPFSFIAT